MKYYSKQTEKSLDNFPFPLPYTSLELIYSISKIKKAAAMANYDAGLLSKETADFISIVCEEILNGRFDDQFITCSLQGGAGTSINMNVNEVIASRASEISNIRIHQNDHVNLSQSTNDVNPSAMRITCIVLLNKLLLALDQLIAEFSNKAIEFRSVHKLGRTHLQDAVPTTLGEEFSAYAALLYRDKLRITETEKFLHDLNLGGTAIGNKINAPDIYRQNVYLHLNKITGLDLKPAENFMSLTANMSDFVHISSVLTTLTLDLSKIANDLRILASGPKGGIGEIILEELQSGSSIMPGKINPVIPESINQIHYFVSGKNQTIHLSAEASFLELANMFPVTADSLISSIKLITSGLDIFSEKCIKTIKADKKRCLEILENSTALATLFTPILGYDKVSEIVKKALKNHTTIRKIIVDEGLLTNADFDKVIKNHSF